MANEIAKREPTALAAPPQGLYDVDVQRVTAIRAAVEQVIRSIMHEGEHYGVIPGIKEKDDKKPKKVLFQPGADVLNSTFRLRTAYSVEVRVEEPTFIYREVVCKLIHIPTGEVWAEGVGSANTRESRYHNQCTARVCPSCGKPTIFKSKRPEQNGSWFCWQAKGGCGAEFSKDDSERIEQAAAISSNKVWELHNTIVKIANKRAKVAAVLSALGASDIFTQDILPEPGDDPEDEAPPQPQQQARRQASASPSAPKCTAIQVRDLNSAISEMEIGVVQAADMRGSERDDFLRECRIGWINQTLEAAGESPIASMMNLTAAQADKLIELAKNRVMPPAPKKGS